ncbi:MAG: hypothetical protein QOG18_221 [Microbacteriaceae bacterium]|jgi:uncharacterized protein (TIGR03086 family)|nr:hypothetical protein [Microbacteriaceae bacterium]MDQ1525608.1 hypothetical protein [Microbacteriaceae bacterium]
MKQKELFLQADAALRSVIDSITPAQLAMPAPADWSRTPDPTVRDIIADHARDEAWVPDVLAGRTIDEIGDRYAGDLLGDDPVASYDRLNDLATAAVERDLDPDKTVHLSYGDFPVSVYLEHISTYRAFQAWLIPKHLGIDYSLPTALVDELWEQVLPQVEDWRTMGVFGPEVDVPAGADRETQLLGKTGFWIP